MMTKVSRILLLVAALALGLVYVLPVWTIDLEAPQYPEGLGMVIEIDAIRGKKPNDLNNINNLNHYIGMKRIEPESIPELKIMPIVLALLIAAGVGAAVWGRRRALYAWVGAFLLIAVVGMADYYRWGYDYGHDLDEENAIIKVPGMSYQPPLIGSKQLLNFRAISWPGSGGWLALASCLIGLGVAGAEFRRGRREGDGAPDPVPDAPDRAAERGAAPSATGATTATTATSAALVALTAGALLAGCATPEPRPLEPGVDTCGTCLMTVADDGHGAEVVLTTGRVYTFDSIECMAGWLTSESADARVHSLWVTDFADPGSLVPAEEALFLRSPSLPSPMGLGLHAFTRAEDRDGVLEGFGGEALDWDGVRRAVAQAWPGGRPVRGAHGGHASTMQMP